MPQIRKCICGCENNSKLYEFPSVEKQKIRRNKWIELLCSEEPRCKRIYACEKHFSTIMRLKSNLRKDAVPDQHLKLDCKEYTQSTKKIIFSQDPSFPPPEAPPIVNFRKLYSSSFSSKTSNDLALMISYMPSTSKAASMTADRACQTDEYLTELSQGNITISEENRALQRKVKEQEEEIKKLKGEHLPFQ